MEGLFGEKKIGKNPIRILLMAGAALALLVLSYALLYITTPKPNPAEEVLAKYKPINKTTPEFIAPPETGLNETQPPGGEMQEQNATKEQGEANASKTSQPEEEKPPAPAQRPFLGLETAKVTITEFASFENPEMRQAYENILPSLLLEYVQTGKAKLVFKHSPKGMLAQKQAEAAECAFKQGKFWQMHNKIIEQGTGAGIDQLKQFASEIGLDETQFNKCMASGETLPVINADAEEAGRLGITKTPAFVVGEKIITQIDYEQLKTAVEEQLAKTS